MCFFSAAILVLLQISIIKFKFYQKKIKIKKQKITGFLLKYIIYFTKLYIFFINYCINIFFCFDYFSFKYNNLLFSLISNLTQP